MKKLLLFIVLAIPAVTKAQKFGNDFDGGAKSMALQVGAGTQGIVADFRYGVIPKLAARLGASYAIYNTNRSLQFSGFNTDATAGINFNNIHLLAEFTPFSGARGLRLVGGAGYLYQGKGHLHLTPTGTYNFASYTYTGAQIGELDMNVVWKGVAPYLGLGLFKSFPNHFFNFNIDLGTYYLTAPGTHITGTNMLIDNNQQEGAFNDYLKQYRWLPVLQFNFNFRIK